MATAKEILENVQDYYGNILKTNKDLKTSACCAGDAFPPHVKKILPQVPKEILERSYGCGSPVPLVLEGKTVLDLGCGTGRDVFILSRLVGPKGQVIGVDMTREQLEVARRHLTASSIKLIEGRIEDLAVLGIANNSIDIVVSNCVINLSPDKKRVFSEIFRVLKPGGELYFSDIFSSRRIEELSKDPILLGECLGGALYIEDFRRLLLEVGYPDYRVVSKAKIDIKDSEIKGKVGMIDFHSLTVRAFKLKLEDRCEDYGQVAVYQGTIPESPNAFVLDDHHLFEKGRPVPVCGNTAAMLEETRYGPHFKIIGDRSTHYGLFDCGEGRGMARHAPTSGACC
ncbi:MAG TPA: methyltransferase domain-containing protein [bacterium]|nr:methyltransferase domain-containing protein [bacterium]